MGFDENLFFRAPGCEKKIVQITFKCVAGKSFPRMTAKSRQGAAAQAGRRAKNCQPGMVRPGVLQLYAGVGDQGEVPPGANCGASRGI